MYATLWGEDNSDIHISEVTQNKNCISIKYRYYIPTTPSTECSVTYEALVLGDGTIRCELDMDAVKELRDLPEFGMLFKLSTDFDRLTQYGLGSEETYADRKRGGKLGVQRNKVKDEMARYLRPQECGNKCDVRYARVTDSRGRGMMFFGKPFYFSALPYSPHEIENVSYKLENPKKKELSDAHAPKFRYRSTNFKIAKVGKDGKITAVNPGKCNVFVYTRNGLSRKIAVTVTK